VVEHWRSLKVNLYKSINPRRHPHFPDLSVLIPQYHVLFKSYWNRFGHNLFVCFFLTFQSLDLHPYSFHYSCVGVWQNDRVEIIANDQGNRTTPSYVSFSDTERLIGDAAKNQVAMNPSNT
jgi:Hsp70 protein